MRIAQSQGGLLPTALNKATISPLEQEQIAEALAQLNTDQTTSTAEMASKVAQHVAWSEGGLSRRVSDVNLPGVKIPMNFSPTRSPKVSSAGVQPEESPSSLPVCGDSPKRSPTTESK